MNREDIIRMAQEIAAQYSKAERFQTWTHDYMMQRLMELVEAERERIKKANAPEIERVNSYIKELEDAVKAEREACAKLCEDAPEPDGADLAERIRARGQA